jgi:hypothetical protein
MARITYVKKTQRRYKMVPVIDPDTGKPKRTPVMGRDGKQKSSKRGLTWMTVTVADKTKPLPDIKCENCGKVIPVGDPHKHVSPKSGPYGGHKRIRCATCPTWQPWDLSNSLSARLQQVSSEAYETFNNGVDTAEDVQSILETAAEAIRGLAEEKRESAQNIEDGFGHETEKSQELNDIADQLESWADEVEQNDVPDLPDESEYVDHDFEPDEDDEDKCAVDGCDKDESEHEETWDDALDNWRSEAEDALSIIDESPV